MKIKVMIIAKINQTSSNAFEIDVMTLKLSKHQNHSNQNAVSTVIGRH